MAIIIPNSFSAYGSVGASGQVVSGSGFVSERTAQGRYLVRLDRPVADIEAAILVTPRSTAPVLGFLLPGSTAQDKLFGFQQAGTFVDTAFDFVVLNVPNITENVAPPPVTAPVPTSIFPDVADTSGGGQPVTISGSGFTSTSQVSLGSVNVSSFTVVDDSTITCIPAARIAGSGLTVEVTNSEGTGSLPGAFEYWSPSDLPSVEAYLDAAKGLTLSGSEVTSWADQGPIGTPFVQASAPNRPQQVGSVFGTLPSIRFTPEQWVARGRRPLPNGFSMFAVVKTTSTTPAPVQPLNAANTLISDANASNGFIQFGMTAGEINLTEFNGATVTTRRGAGYNNGLPWLIGVTHDQATDDQFFYQGSTQQGAGGFVTYPAAGGYEAVGTGYTFVDGWDGDVGAVIVVGAVISSSDLTKLDTWAKQRFGTA